MLCVPVASDAVVKVATPAASVPVPMAEAPSLKVTLPVGVPLAPVTRAVKVTGCRAALGLGDDESEMDVVPKSTVIVTLLDAVVALVAVAVTWLVRDGHCRSARRS